MRKEPKPKSSNSFINLLVLVAIIWGGFYFYNQGHLDNLLYRLGIGWEAVTSIEQATCEGLKKGAIGQELKNNSTGVTIEISAVRNIEEISRTKSELVCQGELLTDGNFSLIEITLSDWDGEFFVEYQAF